MGDIHDNHYSAMFLFDRFHYPCFSPLGYNGRAAVKEYLPRSLKLASYVR